MGASNTSREKDPGKWVPLVLFGGIPLIVLIVALIMVQSGAGPAQTRPSNAIATGEIDDRHVAVVVYETDTFPNIDLFRVGSIGYSVQVEAFDLDSGERLWDTMLSNDYPSMGAEALAVGGHYAYVRSDRGLIILDAENGDILSRDDGVPGLGEDYIASRSAYSWDAEAKQVVLLDANGAVRGIPLGADSVQSASPEVAARWRDELNAHDAEPMTYSETTWGATRDKARLPGPEPTPDPLTGIIPDDNMLYASWAPDDAWNSNIVLNQVTQYAAGSEFGFAVSESHGSSSYTLQVADLETRTARARFETDSGAGIRTVTVDPDGYVVMVMPNADSQGLLVVATADSLHASLIGERGWFGS